jgi:hypothetical protein
METEGVSLFTAAGLIFYLMKYLKTFGLYQRFVSAFPLADKWVYRLVAGVGSLIAALGISLAYHGDATTGWQVSISIPNLNTLGEGIWHWIQVFTAQQLAYDISRRPESMPHDQPVTP